MKTTIFLLSFLFMMLSSCTFHRRTVYVRSGHHLPPGQAKKITGSKSAKPYAPGQRKKSVRSN